jgi:hypothetical protein
VVRQLDRSAALTAVVKERFDSAPAKRAAVLAG